MKVEFNGRSEASSYPFLARDKDGLLCLVGRHSAIILAPSSNGDGYGSPSALVQFAHKKLDVGTSIVLTQE